MKETKQSKTEAANKTQKAAPANGMQESERLVNVVITVGQAARVTPASAFSPMSSAGGSAGAHRIIKLGSMCILTTGSLDRRAEIRFTFQKQLHGNTLQ